MDVKIGVFLPVGVQFMDVAAVDVLGVMSKDYFQALGVLPGAIAKLAPVVSFFYITTPGHNYDVPLSSGGTLKAAHLYTDDQVAPGKLNIVIVPGPIDVRDAIEKGALQWLHAQSCQPGVDILSICTGIFVCAAAGIADNKQVCGPRGMEVQLRLAFPQVRPAGRQRRWIQDGNLWSSGGVTNGYDLLIGYARSAKYWHSSLVDISVGITEVGDWGEFYDQGVVKYTLGFAWHVVRAWFASFWTGSGRDKDE